MVGRGESTWHCFRGPKARPFAQPKATPWGTEAVVSTFGPTGQSLDEGLARWADHAGSVGPISPGRCPGLDEPRPFGADGLPVAWRVIVWRPVVLYTVGRFNVIFSNGEPG